MAKKGGRKGGSAARSAAAKKGWETRRRGGGAVKGKTKATAPTKAITSSGGKMSKAAPNAAKAKYKAAARKVRDAQNTYGPIKGQLGAKGRKKVAGQIGGAKSGATRTVKGLRGGKSGNIGRTKADNASSARQAYAGGLAAARKKIIASRGLKSGGGSKPAKSTAAARPAKMSKAPANAAKSKYKAAKSQARELRMYRGGKSDAVVKKAEAKVRRMESSRRSSRARV